MRIRATVLLAFAATVGPTIAPAQEARPVVYRVPIEGMIDLGLAPFVERVLDEATGTRARRRSSWRSTPSAGGWTPRC